jgi:hypothetical protein
LTLGSLGFLSLTGYLAAFGVACAAVFGATPPPAGAPVFPPKRPIAIATLKLFARLEFRDLDLNLHHVIEAGVEIDAIAAAVAANGQRVWVVSRGWCDFFHDQPRVSETFDSVARQVRLMQALDAGMLRLFFGHFSPAAYDRHRTDVIVVKPANAIRRASRRHVRLREP